MYDTEPWSDMFVASAGAAAALAGLVFVAVSLNIAAIVRTRPFRERALGTVLLLLGAVTVSVLSLSPLSRHTLGIELIVMGGPSLLVHAGGGLSREARSLLGLTNNLIVFGGGKDVAFYREMSELLDDVRVIRQTVTDGPGGVGTSRSGEDIRVLRPGDIRRIWKQHALVIAGNAPPMIAKLDRCLDGKNGRQLKAELDTARQRMNDALTSRKTTAQRADVAIAWSRDHWLSEPVRKNAAAESARPFTAGPDSKWSW